MSIVMDLDNLSTWPKHVIDYLDRYYDGFLKWEVSPQQVHQATYGLCNVLRTESVYVLPGYHCTRLKESEIQVILENGMQLPNQKLLYQRIGLLKQAGSLTTEVAEYLRNKSQSNDSNRREKLWFCFYPPHLAGQRGIERFFRSWGGEALYNSHERDKFSGPVLTGIGIPCIVEAHLPLAKLADRRIDSHLISRYLFNRGFQSAEIYNYEDYVKQPIPAQNISCIITFPSTEFIEMTKCDTWKPPLLP